MPDASGARGSSERIEAARRATITAIHQCLARGKLSQHYDDARTRRRFDVTWSTLRTCVVALTQAVRDDGADLDTVMRAVKDVVHSAAPDLAPHNAIRSAVVGWSVAAFHEGRSRSGL
jgi:hypothetical protein